MPQLLACGIGCAHDIEMAPIRGDSPSAPPPPMPDGHGAGVSLLSRTRQSRDMSDVLVFGGASGSTMIYLAAFRLRPATIGDGSEAEAIRALPRKRGIKTMFNGLPRSAAGTAGECRCVQAGDTP